MAAQQVVVRVVDGSTVVEESVRRPVRLTPHGYAGVTYAGAVYLLLVGNTIDISGDSWEVEDCNRFLLADTPVPYAPLGGANEPQQFTGFDGDLYVDTGQFGHYVLFNASERVATGLVDALETAGLSVQRWDVSHRPAGDGRFYDWFARLRFKGTHEEAIARISDALRPPVPLESTVSLEAAPAPTRLDDLEAKYEKLLDETVELRDRLAASERESSILRERLASATAREAKLSADLDRALEHQRSLRDEISELSRSPVQAVDTKALLAKQSDTEELLELALAENAELRQQLQSLRGKAERGETQIETLEATVLNLELRLEEVADQESEQRRVAATQIAPRRGVAGFLDTAFARLTFVLDSVEVLANLETPSAVMRSLVQIDMGEVVGKDLESIRSWREVSKLATGIAGSESMGRIYYKPDGNRVLVSVHVKQSDKEQRRHLQRLRSL
jgi:hypothetical protein